MGRLIFAIGSFLNGYSSMELAQKYGFFDNIWIGFFSITVLFVIAVCGGAAGLLIYEKWQSKTSQHFLP